MYCPSARIQTPFKLDYYELSEALWNIYMQITIVPSLGRVMACRLHANKQIPWPMLAYCEYDHWERNAGFCYYEDVIQ